MRGKSPAQGDLVTLSFDPQAGHEPKGRRPALVITRDSKIRLSNRGISFHDSHEPRRMGLPEAMPVMTLRHQ